MNREETIELYARGVDAWNEWADGLIGEMERLKKDANMTLAGVIAWRMNARADFSGHCFSEQADFEGFRFPGPTTFDGARFESGCCFKNCQFLAEDIFANLPDAGRPSGASFAEASFWGALVVLETAFGENVSFNKAEFRSELGLKAVQFKEKCSFADSRFLAQVLFDDVDFEGETTFESGKFTSWTRFARSRFGDETLFVEAIFSQSVVFDNVEFQKTVGFLRATLSGYCFFQDTKFVASPAFTMCVFEHLIAFQKCIFSKGADFVGIKGEAAFFLSNTKFGILPDFCQARFEGPPNLDGLFESDIEQWQSRDNVDDDAENSAPARWRALRRLAREGGDFEREQHFLKEELVSRRGHEDRAFELFYWAGLAYQWASNFGLSLSRPLVLLVVSMVAFGVGYGSGGRHDLIEYCRWAETGSENEGSCNPLWSVGVLTTHGAFPFTGLGRYGHVEAARECLYGVTESPAPRVVGMIVVMQFVVSAILLFLVLLAIRNRFRIGR